MRDEDAIHELIRLLKTRFSPIHKRKDKKQVFDYRLRHSKGPKQKTLKIGMVSDIEGDIEGAKKTAKKLKGEEPDLVVIAGDCYENDAIRSVPMFPGESNKQKQMRRCLEPYASIGTETFVIPGNHEKRKVYTNVINRLKRDHPKVRDMHLKTYVTDGVCMIFLGGYHNAMLSEPEGFILDETDYEWVHKTLKKLKKKEKPIVLVSHGPPMSQGMLDFLPFFGNVGDEVLSDIISSFKGDLLNLHGHIHEKGGEQYKFKDTMAINVASVTKFSNPRRPNSSILEISEDRIRYREL